MNENDKTVTKLLKRQIRRKNGIGHGKLRALYSASPTTFWKIILSKFEPH